MDLMEKLEFTPVYSGPKRRHKWTSYKRPYFFLIDEKEFPPIEACRLIGEKEGLTEIEVQKLYRSAKGWRRS